MRQITKTVQLKVDQKNYTFRIKKLDAFSGATLLRILSLHLEGESGSVEDLVSSVFSAMTDEQLIGIMKVCLSSAEVLLDAGFQPIMQMGEWSWQEIEYDTVNALKLTLQVVLWTLDGFFVESGRTSSEDQPAS